MGGDERLDGVGIFVAEKWLDSIVSIERHSKRVLRQWIRAGCSTHRLTLWLANHEVNLTSQVNLTQNLIHAKLNTG